VSVVSIQGGTVLAGSRLERIDDATVLISEDSIEAVGPSSDVLTPPGATAIDAAGLTLMPGFIDSHVHIGFFDPALILYEGVTTVRDLAWPPEEIWPLVAQSDDAGFEGPSIVAVGQMLTVERGYPTRAAWAPHGTGRVVESIDDARAAVIEQVDAGAVSIKVALNPPVGPTLELDTLKAITETAHEFSLRVTSHVYGLEELGKALDASVDELAHMLMSPDLLPNETIARMVEGGVTIVPTLSCFFGEAQRIAIENLANFLAAGGTVVYGTDLGNEGPVPGIDPREVLAMTQAGMNGLDIVTSATTLPARLLGLEDVGRIEPGAAADIVAVRGDAGSDPGSLTEIAMVFRRGRRIR
jgi:imidazolonepropionase-like amidohydrolase